MEVERPFLLTYHTEPTRILTCIFPPQQTTLERLLLRDNGAPSSAQHDIEIGAYMVLVRFQNEFNAQHMLQQAGKSSPESAKELHAVHRIMLPEKARAFYMTVRSAAQLEQQLEVMKQHLLPGAFDDDEEGRCCACIISVVRQPRALNEATLREALHMSQEAGDPFWSARHTLAQLMQLAEMKRRDLDQFQIDTPDDLVFDNVGDAEDDEDACEVYICLEEPRGNVILSIEADRQAFVCAHCALHRILSRHYED
jgi:hypothetical protein